VNQYISDFTLPSITSISATTATDTTTDGLNDDDDRAIQHIGVFDVSGVPDLSANWLPRRRPLAGCRLNTLYYFRATLSSAGAVAVSKHDSTRAIVSVSSEVIDNSGVAVYWEGRAKRWIYWNTTGVFDVGRSLNGIASGCVQRYHLDGSTVLF
jgi:hypothetical protein